MAATALIEAWQDIKMRRIEVDQQRAVMPQGGSDPVAEGRLAEAHEALLDEHGLSPLPNILS